MIVKTESKKNLKKLPMLLVAGALSVAPWLDPVTVQAQSAQFTLNGVVTQDLPGNEFSFRADDGRTFRVVTRAGEPKWLSVNDRVRVRGWRDGDLLVSTELSEIKNSGNNSVNNAANRLTLTGVVTQNLSGNQFLFRTDDNRTFRVQVNGAKPAWVSAGDRIQVRGARDSRNADVLVAQSVQPLNNNGSQSGVMTLTGVVTQNLAGNDFYFRTDDNRTFRVRSTRTAEPSWLRVGNRIEVRGRRDTKEPDVFYADNLRLLSQQGGAQTGQPITMAGTVIRVFSSTRFDVKANNGAVYAVSTTEPIDQRIGFNDQVRIAGQVVGRRSVRAQSVTLVTDQRAMGFNGTVTQIVSPTRLNVKASNGVVYAVSTRSNFSSRITVNDQVRVEGDLVGTNSVAATSLVLLKDQAASRGSVNPVKANTSVNFPGRVESVTNKGLNRVLRVRADNGAIYTVHYRDLRTFRVGDRVRVAGTFNNSIVTASSVTPQ